MNFNNTSLGFENTPFSNTQQGSNEFASFGNSPHRLDLGLSGNIPSFDTALSKPTDFTSGSVRSVRVISCNFVEMVEQATMGFRPFVSKVNETGVLEMIPDIVRENRPGAQFRSESLNPFVNDIIALSANTLGAVPLVNGWNIRRYAFTIMAEVSHTNGVNSTYMIEGFTDTNEISAQGDRVNVDKNMVLFVNNVVNFSERTNNLTGQRGLVPTENFNVINKDPFAQGTPVHSLVTQRPYDVANMSISGMLAGNTSKIVTDARSSVSAIAKTSSMTNNNPATYVNKIINEGITAMDNSHTESMFNTNTINNMLDRVNEPTLSTNGFLKQLGRARNDYPSVVTSFSWGDLVKLDPALGHSSCSYLNVFPISNRGIHLPSSGLSCDDINGSGNEQVFASMIANGMSDLLSRCRATNVSVMATNANCVDQADVVGMRCFNSAEEQEQSKIFEMLFVSNIIQMLNYNTKFQYNIAAQASIWGETYVKVNLGYGNHTFLFPNFANSMYSPMLTNQKAGTENMSKHLLTVANTINEHQYNYGASVRANQFGDSPL